MQTWPSGKYETYAEVDGVKYEIVNLGECGVFGEPTFQACTFQKVMRPSMERRVLGTFNSRAEAEQKLLSEMPKKK